jgi:CRP-like cAMP-binding protein
VPRKLARSDVLFLAGDDGRRIYVLKRGVMKLAARDADGRETILALAVPGDLVGDIAALDGLDQPVDAIAASECELVGLDADEFAETIATDPRAAFACARMLAARLRTVSQATLERSGGEVPARLAGRLLHLADLLGRPSDRGIEVDLPLAQRDLGRLAGICRESTCKTLRSFKAQGMLDYEGRKLHILRADELERIRCEGRV